jgi:zinc protease
VNHPASPEVVETTLPNGMKLLLKEDHTAPIASLWTWYRVGSRNERPGKTGISHWVEHMQFKGTPSLEKGRIFRDVSRVGGTLNALTSHDWTAYFETVPADQIALPLRIEPDRMVNSLFDPEEVESERTVILSERQGAENNPGYALYEEVTGAAFHAHPYRHMVIGYEADLRRITRDDLFDHYRHYYHPANAFLVAVGDFAAADMAHRLEEAFGAIPAGEAVSRDIGVTEPPQPGERRVTLRQPAGAPYLRMAFHAPDASHPDTVPLLVIEAILSGGKPMGFGGGGGMGRSSRLYRALVAGGLARSAESDMSIAIDPYLFQIAVTALPDTDLDEIEQIVDGELDRLRDEAIEASELERAKRQVESQFVYSSEGVTNQAYWLGQWEIVDTWRRAGSLPAEIRAVSVDDVQRVAREYLVPERRTVGRLDPTTTGPAVAETEPPAAFVGPIAWGLAGPGAPSPSETRGLERTVLPNGVVILGQDRPQSQSVVLRVRMPAGSVRESSDTAGLAHLTARSLLRGAGGLTFDEINQRTDALGSSISVDAGREFIEARVRALSGDVPEMTRLLAEIVLNPDFPDDELARVRAEQLGTISELNHDTRATADRLMRGGVYPDPNPLGRRVLGTTETVSRLDRGIVREFHTTRYTPEGATIAIVGGLGGFERAVATIAEAFGAWQGAPATPDSYLESPQNDARVRRDEEIPGKSQADLAAGLATIPRNHPDYYLLDMANLVLGRLGLMGRLGAEVRDKGGLAYYVFSQIEPRVDGSLWAARAGVDPANVERALTAIEAELARLRTSPIGDDELDDARSYSIGVLPLALETHDGMAATLLAIEQFSLGLDYLDRYPDIIARITREDVLAAAAQHLDPSRLAVGVATPS